MNYKLIALDMDGTTLNEDLKLTKKTIDEIKRALDLGVFVVPATGRVFSQIPEELLAIEGIRYTITANGAVTFDIDKNEIIYENPIKTKSVDKLINIFKDYDLLIEAYVYGRSSIIKRYEKALDKYGVPKEYHYMFKGDMHRVFEIEDDYLNYIQTNAVEKFNIFFANIEERRALAKDIENNTDLKMVSSIENNLEINNPAANKGDALQKLASFLNIQRENVLAIGDSANDIEMLKMAGKAVVMDNARSEMKAYANYITKSNREEGVAHALQEFL